MNANSHYAAPACEVSPAAPAPAPAAGAPIVVPIELANNHVYVRVCYGEQPLWFLLDTGAGYSLLDFATAQRFGAPLGDAVGARGAGAGGLSGALTPGLTVHLPEAPGAPLEVMAALPFGTIAAYEGRDVHGILGHNFIARYVLAIDYHGRRLLLYEPGAFAYRGAGTRVPLTMNISHPHVRAGVVLGDGRRIDGDFVVDVGSGLALALTQPFVERHGLRAVLGPTLRRVGGRGVGGGARADIGRVAELRVGAAVVRRPVASLFGDSSGVFSTAEFFEGNIGGQILRRFTVFLDYGRAEMILEPNPASAEPFEADMSGLDLTSDPDLARVRIAEVAPGTPAAAAELALGDVITAVDGRPVTGRQLDELRQRLAREGERVTLTVERPTRRWTVRLVTRRLV